MSWFSEGWRRVHALAQRRALERGLDEEIEFHLTKQIEKNLRQGMSFDEARRHALIKFGGVQHMKERTRDEFHMMWFEDWFRDIRYSVRALRRATWFTGISSLMLAIGIGSSTAVFSVINSVLLQPLPYPRADSLVILQHVAPGANLTDVPMASTQFYTYRTENKTFEQLGLWQKGVSSVTGRTQPEEVQSLQVTAGTLQTLGVAPVVGRWFTEEDDTPGTPETVVLAHAYWQRRFGGDRSILGQTLTIDARPRQVIGVMPDRFRFLNDDIDVILPFRFDRAQLILRKPAYQGIARLKPGVTLAQANADVARMLPMWIKGWPPPPGAGLRIFERARFAPALRPLKEAVVGDVGNVLWVLMGTVGIVLLIACANVANLLLVRSANRQQEFATRAALGAGAGRLAREQLIESIVLALLGGALGLAIAYAVLRLLVAAGPAGLPRLAEIRMAPVVLAFSFGASLLSGLLFGLIPILKRAGPRISKDLRGGGRTLSQSREQHRARNTLVVVQIALALVLLIASGLMIRTFQRLREVQPGFSRPEQIQLVRLTIPSRHVSDPEQVVRMQQNIRDRVAALPGVADAAFANAAPLEPDALDNILQIEGQTYADGQIPPDRRFKFVSPDFFKTVGISMVAGRDYSWTDLYERRQVAIVSENLAREIWREPAQALGKRVRANNADPWREIVGVVGNVHDNGVHERAPATVYWPVMMANFWRNDVLIQRGATFVIRSPRAGTEQFLSELNETVWAVNANLPLAQVRTLRDLYDRSLARTSFTLVMLAVAGATALLLGVVGIYGVISYAVTQRTREIGIRAALGAQHTDLKRMFVRDGLLLAVVGVICGLVAAGALTRFMSTLLFGVNALDVTTYVAVSLVLGAAAALASYVPARRAAMVDPVIALRAE